MSLALNKLTKRPSIDTTSKPKRKLDRFDGLTEEEVQKYTLEDILAPDLDLVFVGINPSLMAAHRGRYYAGPGNHFYKLLHASGLVPRFVSFEEDKKLLDYKIGLTNIVSRATRSSADLKKPEIKAGAAVVREKIAIFQPRIAIFNGKCIYEVFAEKTTKSVFHFGLQSDRIGETAIWVVPSSSARCAHFPRMSDKLHFYQALKKYLSSVKGEIRDVDATEFRFDGKCRQTIPSTSRMWRRKCVSAFLHGGRVANSETVCLDTSEENIATINGREFIVTEILDGNSENREFADCEQNDEIMGEDDEPKKACDVELDAQEMSSSEEITSQEIQRFAKALPIDINPSTAFKRNNNTNQRLKRTVVNKSFSQTFKSRDKNDSTDFMNLIKRRLSEKKEREDCAKDADDNSKKPVQEAKKLKYSNLRLKSGKKVATVGSESLPSVKDSTNYVLSD